MWSGCELGDEAMLLVKRKRLVVGFLIPVGALAVAMGCAGLEPTPKPTPLPIKEWNLEGIQVDGSTVTVVLRVYAGIDVRVTLDVRDPDQVKGPPPILEYVFQNVTPGKHTIQVRDVVGYKESAEVVVLPQKAPDGPLDTALAEVTILLVQDDLTKIRVEEIRDYIRLPDATYPRLNVGDEILVRVYHLALAGVSGAKSVEMGVKEGDLPPVTPQPELIEGGKYLADMSGCFSDYFGGLSCPYDGWSVALYPFQESSSSITPQEESDRTPPSTTPIE